MNRSRRFLEKSILKTIVSSFLRGFPTFIWTIFITSILSIIGFILFSFIPSSIDYFALVPEKIMNGKNLWTLLTHIFFHASFFHLFLNMFSLFFIGSIVEAIIGRKRFVWLYLISGLFAGIFFVFSAFVGSRIGLTSIFGDVNIAGVGASGALFGLLGLLAVLIPRKKVYLIAGPIVLIIIDAILSSFISNSWFLFVDAIINILILLTIFSLFLPFPFFRKLAMEIEMPLWIAPIIAIVPLVVISVYISLPIGNSAHFGGLIIGVIYGVYLRIKYPKKVALIGRIIR